MKGFWERFPYFLVRSVKKPSEAFKVIRAHAPTSDVLGVVAAGGASLLVAVLLASLPAQQGGHFHPVVLQERATECVVYYAVACLLACAFAVVVAPVAGWLTGKSRLYRTLLGSLLVVAVTSGTVAWVVAALLVVEGGILSAESQPFAYGLFAVVGFPLGTLAIMEIHELDAPKALGIATLGVLPILLFAGLFALAFLP